LSAGVPRKMKVHRPVTKFAFIIHPLNARDMARKYRWAAWLPAGLIEWLMTKTPVQKISEITGIRSATGAQTTGWFVVCPMTARQLVNSNPQQAIAKIIEAGRMAEQLGAQIVGLGAFTAVVGEGGTEVAEALDIAVTTGNSYTVFTAVQGVLEAARQVGIEPSQARAAVLGASGSIGRVCAHLLAPNVGSLVLADRRQAPLEQVSAELAEHQQAIDITTDIAEALAQADLVVTVTSALEAIVHPEMLKPGAVVCDVARPRDVSRAVADQRKDVLVIEGGVVKVPGEVQFNFDFGFPPQMAYACMAETMILALEGRCENFSLGRKLQPDKVREIGRLAEKHGFQLAGFRSFEEVVSQEQIQRVRGLTQRSTQQTSN